MLLRIEDLDTQRCPRSYADAIMDDLAWLGLAADGPMPPVYQSDRSEIYQRYFRRIVPPWAGLPLLFAAAVSCTRPVRPTAATGRSSTPGPAAA